MEPTAALAPRTRTASCWTATAPMAASARSTSPSDRQGQETHEHRDHDHGRDQTRPGRASGAQPVTRRAGPPISRSVALVVAAAEVADRLEDADLLGLLPSGQHLLEVLPLPAERGERVEASKSAWLLRVVAQAAGTPGQQQCGQEERLDGQQHEQPTTAAPKTAPTSWLRDWASSHGRWTAWRSARCRWSWKSGDSNSASGHGGRRLDDPARPSPARRGRRAPAAARSAR